MARQPKVSVQNAFTKGLVTENTALQFPEDACTETFNCVFDETGRVTRRPGYDVETTTLGLIGTLDAAEVYTEFVWNNVGGIGTRTFVVQQQGRKLHFYDISIDTSVTNSKLAFTLDLTTAGFRPAGATDLPEFFPCQYAAGRGNLVVVNAAINPLLLRYNADSNNVNVTVLNLQQRDFTGLDDGLGIDQRPGIDPTDLSAQNPQHLYNLINQGWYVGGATPSGMSDAADILNQWSAARNDSPSNADIPSLYRDTTTLTGAPAEGPGFSDTFNPNYVKGISTGNTLAPKGHFILDVFSPNRVTAMAAEGYSVVLPQSTFITDAIGTTISFQFPTTPAKAFDKISTAAAADCAKSSPNAAGFIGKSLTTGTLRILAAYVFGSNDEGYSNALASVTLQLRAKTGTAPTVLGEGTLLGTITFTDTNDESAARIITSGDTTTFWNHVWIEASTLGVNGLRIAEIRIQAQGSESSLAVLTRPSTTTFYVGRTFYAGINAEAHSSSIYFTQIIERDSQYGQCYQQNDPSNEHFTDLLPSDGGVIKIPEAGLIKKLSTYQSALLIFATNGVWIISGSSQDAFQANDFQIRKISGSGTNSPLSFCEIKGVPYWFGEDGIYTLTFDAVANSFAVVSITDQQIKSFFDTIPVANRQFVKASYCIEEATIHWLYNSSPLTSTNHYDYNAELHYNTLSKAFMPWTISTPDAGVNGKIRVRGVFYAVDGAKADDPQIKYTVTGETGDLPTLLGYAHTKNTITWRDWSVWGTSTDYSSYFISGYKFDGETQRLFQPAYVYVFLENEENAGCFMRGVFDFAVNGNSGKWSTPQQVYNVNLLERSVNFRRLKVRGNGRALQLRFQSETGKPFTIIGWSLWNLQNQTP